VPDETAPAVAPLTLVVGDEEFLTSRGIEDVRAAALTADPETEVIELESATLDSMQVLQVLSPSLFGGRRLVVLRSAQDLKAELAATAIPMLISPDEDTMVVVQHLGRRVRPCWKRYGAPARRLSIALGSPAPRSASSSYAQRFAAFAARSRPTPPRHC